MNWEIFKPSNMLKSMIKKEKTNWLGSFSPEAEKFFHITT